MRVARRTASAGDCASPGAPREGRGGRRTAPPNGAALPGGNDASAGFEATHRREATAAMDREIARLLLIRRELGTIDARLLGQCVACFGSIDAAVAWLASPEILLGGEVPAELAASADGRAVVRRVLAKLREGMFT